MNLVEGRLILGNTPLIFNFPTFTKQNANILECFGNPDQDRVLRIKSGHAPKQLGLHDLVTPVPGFENRGFHLVLDPLHCSLTAGGKKHQFSQ